MTPETSIDILQSALQLALVVAAPLLVAALAIGVVIGLLQAATQVNEPSIAFIGKLAGLSVVIFVAGPWMLARLVEFTRGLIQHIPSIIG